MGRVILLAMFVSCAPPTTTPVQRAPTVVAPAADAAIDAPGNDATGASAIAPTVDDAGDHGPEFTFTAVRGTHQTLELRWANAWNRHWAAQAGADHENDSGTVTVGLDVGGRGRVVDRGQTVTSVLDGDRFHEKSTRWLTSWLGTWTLGHGRLSLNLKRDKTACVITETQRLGAKQFLPSKSACSSGLMDLVLECSEHKIEMVATIDDLQAKPAPTLTWRCEPQAAATGATVGTRLPWVFGTPGCVETTGGVTNSGPVRYAHCR